MGSIPQVAERMMALLSTVADQVGRATGFVQRQSRVRGSVFVQLLTFGLLGNPTASLSTLALGAADLGVTLSPQGLDQRFTEAGAQTLELVVGHALRTAITGPSVAIPLLERFTTVAVHDATTVGLPAIFADRWEGCGNGTETPAAACKLQLQIDLRHGQVRGDLFDGRDSDRNQTLDTTLPAGSLRLADLGYWDVARLRELDARGIYWLSRGHTQTALRSTEDAAPTSLLALLEANPAATMDMPVWVGVNERMPARLIARRVPQEVVDQRRRRLRAAARADGRTVSATVLALAAWAIFVTNCPPELLSAEEAEVLGRIRWQIELIFKLWKSHGAIDNIRAVHPWRQLCEFYAKLLGMILTHWLIIVSCWHMPDRSLTKAAQAIRARVAVIAYAMGSVGELTAALLQIAQSIAAGCHMNSRRKHPNAYQLLFTVGGEVLA